MVNIDQLHQDQALASAIKDSTVPKAIIGAISLVELLEERCLWVDRLCIIQDNVSARNQQIQSMAGIYADASLTIVTADDSHANHGLRGLRNVPKPEPRSYNQNVFKLADRTPVIEILWPQLANTKWLVRVWTSQEDDFSQRRIILEITDFDGNVSNTWQESIDFL